MADPYAPLFQTYRQELRALYEKRVSERNAAVRRRMDAEGIEEQEARQRIEDSNGPLVHDGRVIHLIRKYWLEVDRLKRDPASREDDGFLEPLTFLVEDLAAAGEDDLVEFLTEIAYWPIGRDENNQWT